MTVKNKTNKNYKRSQRGRSMVEMLGVLAIVGVLSVGGVYGYGVAMKKHKANEALHKASMLATTVSAYAMSNDGNLPSSIADFANLGYDTALSDDGTQFKLTMKGVGSDVCKQMESSMGGMVRKVTCIEGSDDAVITYYKNLATTEAEGEKSPTGSKTFDPDFDSDCKNISCAAGEKCFSGVCQKVADCDNYCCASENSLPSFTYIPNAACGDCDPEEDENCPLNNTVPCTQNSDCNGQIANGITCSTGNCYCFFADGLDYEEEGVVYIYPGMGLCMPFSKDEKEKKKSETDFFSYYSALNFCKALGKTLPSKSSDCNETNASGCIENESYYWFSSKPSDGECEVYNSNFDSEIEGPVTKENCNEMIGQAICI